MSWFTILDWVSKKTARWLRVRLEMQCKDESKGVVAVWVTQLAALRLHRIQIKSARRFAVADYFDD